MQNTKRDNPFSSINTALTIVVALGLMSGARMMWSGQIAQMTLLVVGAVAATLTVLALTKWSDFSANDVSTINSFLTLGSAFFLLYADIAKTGFQTQVIGVAVSLGLMALALFSMWVVPGQQSKIGYVKSYSGLLAMLSAINMLGTKDFAYMVLTFTAVVVMAAFSISAVLLARKQEGGALITTA